MKLIFVVLMFFFECGITIGESNPMQFSGVYISEFSYRIASVHKKVVDLTDVFSLHHCEEFNEVYLSPLKYENVVIQYLQTRVSFENKIIAICMMTKLPLNQYIGILNSYYMLYKKDQIDEKISDKAIFNEFDDQFRLAKQYKNPKIRLFLNKLINDKTLSNGFKIGIKRTLSGKWYDDIRKVGKI